MDANVTQPNEQNPSPVRVDILSPDGAVLYTSEFVKEKIVLGRILSADVRIDDPRVSRIHALIEVRGNELLITDLASSHGTFLHGKKIIESKLSFGDRVRLGFVEIQVSEGSGQVTSNVHAFEGTPVHDGDETRLDIDRSLLDKLDRRNVPGPDRRQKDAIPEERRLDDRRGGDRRTVPPAPPPMPKGAAQPPPVPPPSPGGQERRLGSRRKGERRIFDITSLERRIADRRARKTDDDILPEDLEKFFTAPSHLRELEVTALWGDHILDVSNYVDPTVLSVGESPDNEYIIPSVGIPDEFPLVTIEDDGTAYLAFTEEMSGTVRARDKIYNLAQLRQEKFVKRAGSYTVVGLKQDDFAKISIGTINFFLLYVRPAPRIKRPPFVEKDPILFRTFFGSLLLLAVIMGSMSFVEKPKPVTLEMVPERFAKIVIRPKPKIPPKMAIQGDKDTQGGSKAGEGGPPKGPEGEVGKPELPKKPEKAQALAPKSKPVEQPKPQVAKAPPPKVPQPQRKVVDKEKAKSVGLLQLFNQAGIKKDMQNLVDAGEGAPGRGGFDDFGKAVTGLRGRTVEESGGAGGKGVKGVDTGGGGKTIGIDGPSTKGLGRGGSGDGIGEGIAGPGRLGMKGEAAVSIVSENVQILSGLSKDIIESVVRQHRSEIRSCYDQALRRNPNMRGKVVVAFNIQPNGIVSSASVKESSIGDSGLETCITSRIRSWVFPKPEAPVVTEVAAYPFLLNPTN